MQPCSGLNILLKAPFLNTWTAFWFKTSPFWYTNTGFAQSKMILSRAWLHDSALCSVKWHTKRCLFTEKDARRAPIYDVSKNAMFLRCVNKNAFGRKICLLYSFLIEHPKMHRLFFWAKKLIDYKERLGKSKVNDPREYKNIYIDRLYLLQFEQFVEVLQILMIVVDRLNCKAP